MASSAAAPAPVGAGPLTHRQIVSILTGLMMGMFLAALDQNIVGTAIRTIADDLQGLSAQAWVTTAYLITSTITTPLYGKLSDLYGRKRFFLAAITIFMIGSVTCAFAQSMYQLAAFRALQGLGAGGLFSLALAIIGDVVPPRERAKYQGYFLAVFGTSSVLGPIIGGFFAGADSILGITGWRWVFLVNVPVGLVALLTVSRTLHLRHVPRRATVDWWGASFLVVALVPLLTVAEQGREWGWSSALAIACYVIGGLGLAAFIAAEKRAGDDALIPLRIFRNRTIAIALSGGLVVGSGMFGGLLVIPQYLQIVHNASPTESGFMMLPLVLGIMTASVASGQLISRTGHLRAFPFSGVMLMVVGLLLLSRIGADTDVRILMSFMLVFGFGLGLTMQPLTLAVQAAVHPREMGMATSAATFFRQIGGTVGVAVFLSVLFGTLADNIRTAFTQAASDASFLAATADPTVLADPTNRAFVEALANGDQDYLSSVMSDSSLIGRLDPTLAHPFKVAFAQSMDLVFLLGAAVCAVGVLVLFFLPNVHLSDKSGATLLAEQEAAAGATSPGQPAAVASAAPHGDHADHAELVHDLTEAAAAEAGGHTLDELPESGMSPADGSARSGPA